MFLQLDPNAVDNPGKCLFPLEKAQELHLQALGLLVKWFFTKGRAALLLKSLNNSGFGVDINDVSGFGVFFFLLEQRFIGNLGLLAMDWLQIWMNLSWNCWVLTKDCV